MILPFSTRLSLFSRARDLGATLLVFNVGSVFALTALITFYGLHKPEIQPVPRSVHADMLAYQYGLPAGAVAAFLSLLAPLEEVGGPFAGLGISVRALGLFWAWGVFFLVLMVAAVFIRRRTPSSIDEAHVARDMGRIFQLKMRTVNNTLF